MSEMRGSTSPRVGSRTMRPSGGSLPVRCREILDRPPRPDRLLESTLVGERLPEDPTRFDISRRPAATTTFGFGQHFCLGAHLARAELEVSLRDLLSRLPKMRLADDPGVRIGATFCQLLRGPNRLPVRFD